MPEAIEDAKVNSEINGIRNTLFFAGDMKDMLTQDFINEYGRPDVIITDPPRAGMHQDVVDVILFAEPKRIVYVSCNPATQARDLQLLDAKYRVKAVQPVDMFPHTHHVENGNVSITLGNVKGYFGSAKSYFGNVKGYFRNVECYFRNVKYYFGNVKCYLGNRSRDWATGSRTPEKRYGIPVSRCKALF